MMRAHAARGMWRSSKTQKVSGIRVNIYGRRRRRVRRKDKEQMKGSKTAIDRGCTTERVCINIIIIIVLGRAVSEPTQRVSCVAQG